MSDKQLYKQAVDELTTGELDQALWAMVWTKAGGEENAAKAKYVEARVQEIAAQEKTTLQMARPPLQDRIPWRLLGLFAGAAAFTIINRSIAEGHENNAPVLRWDFWLVSAVASTLGLMLIPGLALLITWGSRWGYRVASLFLGVGGCLAGYGGLPRYAYDTQDAVAGYFWTGFAIVGGWILYAVIVADLNRPTSKTPESS